MDVKRCHKCGTQARCSDSRQCNGYVRRRYICQCGERWTTMETRGEPNGLDGERWRYFRDKMDESHKLRMLAGGTVGYNRRVDRLRRAENGSDAPP